MATVNSKRKNIMRHTEKKSIIADFPVIVVCAVTGFISAKAVWADISLAVCGLLLTAAQPEQDKKAAAGAGYIFSLLILTVRNTFYLPYMVSAIVYITFYTALKKEKVALAFSAVFLAVTKAVVVSTGRYGLVFAAAESAALLRLAGVLENCRDLYNPYSWPDIADSLLLVAGGMVVVLSLSGADSRIVYPGAALCLGTSLMFCRNSSVYYGLLALICCFISLADKSAFCPLFISFGAVWAVSVYTDSSHGPVCPVALVAAVILNIAFLPLTENFTIIGTVLMALVFFVVMPVIIPFRRRENLPPVYAEKGSRQLISDMQKLEKSLNYLGSCAIDISKVTQGEEKLSLEDMVAEDVCRSCSHSAYCWQEKYSYTAQQFSKYAKSLRWRGENGFEMGFYSQCVQIEKIKKSFEENSRILLSKRYIQQSQKNNQHLLQSAFMAVAARVGDLIHNSRTGSMVNASVTAGLDSFLQSIDAKYSYCLCTQNPDRATVAMLQPADDGMLYRIAVKLESLYNGRFTCGKEEKQGSEYIYSFYSTPALDYTAGERNIAYRQTNGDSSMVIQQEDRLYVLLSDGMGTGPSAAAESRTVTAMAQSLAGACISPGNMLDIVNLAMNLRGSGEGGATLDMLCVNLADGKAVLLKAGASSTIVINENEISRYSGDSLPLGVVKDVKYHSSEFVLRSGDTVIMMTDGVGEISSNVQNMYSQSCDEIASYVINENKTMDDKTAIVLKLTERETGRRTKGKI